MMNYFALSRSTLFVAIVTRHSLSIVVIIIIIIVSGDAIAIASQDFDIAKV